jgi:hypothetical protein
MLIEHVETQKRITSALSMEENIKLNKLLRKFMMSLERRDHLWKT